MSEINITVSGCVGSGKTTIARLIKFAIQANGGLIADLDDLDNDDNEIGDLIDLVDKMEYVSEKDTKINIRTFQTPRGGIHAKS